MRKRLGISIYPNQSTVEEDIEYIKLANKNGFERVFTCLLSVEGDKEIVIANYKKTITYARELGMDVIADISPCVFTQLKIAADDLSFFRDIGATGIRLDIGFTGQEEAMMTYNPYGLKIELNMSTATKYIDHLLTFQPNRKNLLGCHNFYPHKYSGLSYPFFIECSKKFSDLGIRTAAFVSSPEATFGPWPIVEGLPTLEMHRDLAIDVQAKHLFATQVIDDVIIGNAYASEHELKMLGKMDKDLIIFSVKLYDGISNLERTIVLDRFHFYRGDVSDYMIRSTGGRISNRTGEIKPFNTRNMKRGDVLIDNDLYGQYAGELQIALNDMENSGKTNVVGRIREEEIFLLDYLQPWGKFTFHKI
ncbi:MupG family TIM beta-alpha barrel fold protein [Bacillus aquiflavi]|uniref:DUF871 domain-containing protein n=1 Tax=Bacillus aquiflavi TaxID=2672567 RepID=UPI001CA90D5A|nr:MupG family TIM beta-alpha barrel fold protein [Bacillus aquiflavi]UAC47822.1 MupG family TIM beta-alpha barrel fold protein [Bacillus aquiflavi]